MKILDVENIKIPSINGKFGYNPKTGRLYLQPKYKAFKDTLEKMVIQFSLNEKIEPPYSLKINVSTALDIDNFIKPLQDSLKQAKLIDDDKNILQLVINKIPVKKGSPNSLQIFLNNINEV